VLWETLTPSDPADTAGRSVLLTEPANATAVVSSLKYSLVYYDRCYNIIVPGILNDIE